MLLFEDDEITQISALLHTFFPELFVTFMMELSTYPSAPVCKSKVNMYNNGRR